MQMARKTAFRGSMANIDPLFMSATDWKMLEDKNVIFKSGFKVERKIWTHSSALTWTTTALTNLSWMFWEIFRFSRTFFLFWNRSTSSLIEIIRKAKWSQIAITYKHPPKKYVAAEIKLNEYPMPMLNWRNQCKNHPNNEVVSTGRARLNGSSHVRILNSPSYISTMAVMRFGKNIISCE